MRRLIAITALALALLLTGAAPAHAQGAPPPKPDTAKVKVDTARAIPDSAKAKAVNIVGSWYGAISTPNGNQDLTVTIKKDSAGYSGSVASSQGEVPIYDVKIEGDKVSFGSSVPTPNGNFEMWYSFVIKDDAMNGQIEGSFNGQSFALPLSLKRSS